VARANPLWQKVSDGSDVLAIFQGPNRYISPKWYPSKQEHGRVVPTWNYLVVHGRGRITWHHDLNWLRKLLEALTDVHEDSELPWRVSDAPEDFVERMLSAIVGFEIRIADLKGMWKLSQNRSAEDRLGVIAGLKSQSNAAAADMLDWKRNTPGT
jgi:transcriptional regulator